MILLGIIEVPLYSSALVDKEKLSRLVRDPRKRTAISQAHRHPLDLGATCRHYIILSSSPRFCLFIWKDLHDSKKSEGEYLRENRAGIMALVRDQGMTSSMSGGRACPRESNTADDGHIGEFSG